MGYREYADIAVIDGEKIADTPPYQFTDINTGGGNTFTLSSLAKCHGDYGYRLLYTTPGSNINYGRKIFTDKAYLYARGYFFLSNNFMLSQYSHSGIITLRDGNTVLCRVQVSRYGSGTGVVDRWTILGQELSTTVRTTEMGVGVWKIIEIHWKAGTGSDGGAQVWINGTSLFSEFNNNLTAYASDNLLIGSDSLNIPVSGSYLDADDILLSTIPIGEYNPMIPDTVLEFNSNFYSKATKDSHIYTEVKGDSIL